MWCKSTLEERVSHRPRSCPAIHTYRGWVRHRLPPYLMKSRYSSIHNIFSLATPNHPLRSLCEGRIETAQAAGGVGSNGEGHISRALQIYRHLLYIHGPCLRIGCNTNVVSTQGSMHLPSPPALWRMLPSTSSAEELYGVIYPSPPTLPSANTPCYALEASQARENKALKHCTARDLGGLYYGLELKLDEGVLN